MQDKSFIAAALRLAFCSALFASVASISTAQLGRKEAFIGPVQGTKNYNNNFGGPKQFRGKVKFLPRPNVVLVAFKSSVNKDTASTALAATGLIADPSYKSAYLVRAIITPAAQMKGVTIESAIAKLKKSGTVRLAEPDMPVYKEQVNDPDFAQQWGLHNTGQTGGTADADVDAPEGWLLIGAASPVIVAVCDDAVDINHGDLAGNIALNDDIPLNGIDDDGNGFIDDYRGWDFADGDFDPSPPTVNDSHGTHVAGIVAAVSDNAIGVASASRNVKIMPLRFYKGQAGWISDLILALDYARLNGAKVVNVSYNLDGFTQLFLDAVVRLNTADVVYCNSAGNNGQQDPPRLQMKPSAPNATFVIATDHNDQIAGFSNYGMLCEIGAPGDNVRSTLPVNTYGNFSGTSMASPFAAGIIGTVRSNFPALTAPQVIARVANSSDSKPQYVGKMSNGRINLNNTYENDTTPPDAPGPITLQRRSYNVIRLGTTASGDDGNTGAAASYDVRRSSSPITAGNFASATPVFANLPQAAGGTPVTFDAQNLPSQTSFYLAIRAVDNLGNPSPITSAGPFKTAKPISVDNMEAVSPTFTGTGTWARTAAFATSPTQSWTDSPGGDYVNNENSTLTSGTLAVGPNQALGYQMKHNLESGFDFVDFEVSTDSGATWTTLNSISGVSSGFNAYTVSLSSFAGQNILYRFHLTTDSSVIRDGVYIDDIEIKTTVNQLLDNVEGAAQFSTGASTWVISPEFAASPVNAWNDGPGVDYLASTNQLLTGTANINTDGVAGPKLQFAGRIDLEGGFDFLEVLDSADGGATWTTRAAIDDSDTEFATYVAPIGSGFNQRIGFRLTSDSSVQNSGVAIDDFRLVGDPWINCLLGNLTLSSYNSVNPRTLTVQIRNVGTTTVVESHVIQTGGIAGNFEIETALTGTYDVAIKGAHFLRRIVPSVVLGPSVNVPAVLITGDINGDNSVGALDFNALRAAFGSIPTSGNWNTMADLNGDGAVGALDFNILRANFGQSGPL